MNIVLERIYPDLILILDVPESELIRRVVGRRLDPVTGRIYHMQYSPPEDQHIASRLIQRTDDTEEKVFATDYINSYFLTLCITRLWFG